MAEALRSPLLEGVPHGFMARSGGVSTGVVAGLQCGYGAGDEEAAVEQNRQLAVDAVLPGAALATVHQVHSALAVVAQAPWPKHARPHADALVTDRPGLVLGILTADCAPVLLVDREHGVVGAAHAGWRGARTGVIEAAIAAMESLGARREGIAACIGPCIAQASYEVGADMRAQFDPSEARHFATGKGGHWQFDLAGYVAGRLRASGIGAIDDLAEDTYAQPHRFYSFRRATHQGEAGYGRQISLIGLAS